MPPKQTPSTKTIQNYAANEAPQIIKELKSSVKGLSLKEAEKRLREFGKNILVEEKKKHWLMHFLNQFKNPLILILLFASIVSFVTGAKLDAMIIGIIILASTLLNFSQEYKADKAAQKLKDKLKNKATVLRDGKQQEVHFTDICVGDLICLNAGDLIPADARIIESHDFFINQSALTGESFPQEKSAEILNQPHLSLSDLKNIVFSGTNVVTGSATAIIVKIGKETEFGKIAKSLNIDEGESEFSKGINKFSALIMKLTMFLVLFIFLFNSITKANILESFMFAIAIAVGLTPELLPMILSITMGNGAIQMAKKGAIVKKLAAIPAFGSMDVLCTDKTGTLTQDKIVLVKYIDCEGNDSDEVLLYAYLNSYFQTGITNPLDDAVLQYKKESIKGYKKINEIPFDFLRKKMSIVVENNGERYLITKGAPEEVLKSSREYAINGQIKDLDKKTEKNIMAKYEQLSDDGFRVLTIAYKKVDHVGEKKVYSKDDECDLNLLGFVAFLDPVKKDAEGVVKQMNSMGVEVKIITGDNELVTKKVCKELDINVKGVLLGYQIDALTDDALRVVVEKTTIFARFSPDEKNRIIHALKSNNHVVGYMGDGINDAPSLRTADVGISVSNAVDVAKESAAIILTNKSLEELVEGIKEGRKTFGNSMKYIMMGISSNFGNMFSVLGAVLFLPFLPMLPIQILLNNLLYDFSQIALPKDNVDQEFIMTPKRWNMDFIKKFMLVFGIISSLFDFITFFFLHVIFKVSPAVFQTAWFMESLATQVLIIHIIRTRKIPFIQSIAHRDLILTTFAVLIVGWILPFTSIGHAFEFMAPTLQIVGTLIAIVITYLVTVEIAKRFFYKKYNF